MRVSHFKDRVDTLLVQALTDLSMTLGVLARIENNNYEIVAVQSNSGAFVPGEKYELGQSFSREVFENHRIIAETCIENSSQILRHPLYRSLPLESYIGAPITLQGEPWGCLDFSSMAQRDAVFSEQDLKLIRHLASEISELLSSLE
ncbi:MAG: GAF domain-containing protein [Gammaproteobacteria bacterium]|nr:MAG: GAF domain-containing protein [Gammaproteobacteria bacterium]UCH41866.1 MAG: GAF domain-containing protein [Gammaproteobacteria bacterium]